MRVLVSVLTISLNIIPGCLYQDAALLHLNLVINLAKANNIQAIYVCKTTFLTSCIRIAKRVVYTNLLEEFILLFIGEQESPVDPTDT